MQKSPIGTSNPVELIAPVHRVLAPLARRVLQIGITVTADAMGEVDLTPLEFAALSYLKDEPGIDQAGLAHRIGIDPSNASLLVNGLELKGFVKRRVNESNRRARLLFLTRRGGKFVDRVRPRVRAANARVLATLSAQEKATLLDLLARIVEANKVHARPGTGRRKRTRRSLQQEKAP